MKSLLIILFLLPLSLSAQQFRYDNISTGQKGTDFFASDRSSCQNANGTIEFFRNRVMVDGEKFAVKKVRKDDVIKTDKGMIKVVYAGAKKPVYVQVLRYNTLLTYHINDQEPQVAAVLNK